MSEYHGDEGIVDVERRKDTAEYALGDPTVFPPEFLTWLKRFIEQSGIQLPSSAIFGSFTAGISSVRNLAPGIILPYAAPTPPPGALACDGTAVSRATYAKLFDIIGTIYGAPDGSTFTLPDYRGRTLFGAGAALSFGATDGLPEASRGAQHRHTVNETPHAHPLNDPGHSHTMEVGNVQDGSDSMLQFQSWSNHQSDRGTSHVGTGISIAAASTGVSVGPAGKPLDAPAFAGILYVITTG